MRGTCREDVAAHHDVASTPDSTFSIWSMGCPPRHLQRERHERFVGERHRKVRLASLLALAEGDQADAWEPVGTGSF